MELIVQPDDGLDPVLDAVNAAERRIDILIFRFDRPALEKALQEAVERGVVVRALIAYTNRGGEQLLRTLEQRLLERGVTVSRTSDDLVRYHGKMLIVDDQVMVLGFNYTRIDIEKSRSFGLISKSPSTVAAAEALFEADSTRQSYVPRAEDEFVVSPESSRAALTRLIAGAQQQILVYDEKVSDAAMTRLLVKKLRDGLDVRVIGKVGKGRLSAYLPVAPLAGRRLHVRAIVIDGEAVFVGSQSLRRMELDRRREIGLICRTPAIARRVAEIFEEDWTRPQA